MTAPDPPAGHVDAKQVTPPQTGSAGLVRRWLAGWRRIEETIARMDYSPYDHVTDRLSALEQRVAALEDLQSATPRPDAPTRDG